MFPYCGCKGCRPVCIGCGSYFSIVLRVLHRPRVRTPATTRMMTTSISSTTLRQTLAAVDVKKLESGRVTRRMSEVTAYTRRTPLNGRVQMIAWRS